MRVKDEYRTNALSLKPGGVTVQVVFNKSTPLEYVNIKNPKAYCDFILRKKDPSIIGIYIIDANKNILNILWEK